MRSMPTNRPWISPAQAARANEIVFHAPGVTCATALVAERSDGRFNLYLYTPDALDMSRPWIRIPPDTARTRNVTQPGVPAERARDAVWAGISTEYIGEGEPLVCDVEQMECDALNIHEGVRSVRGHGINE